MGERFNRREFLKRTGIGLVALAAGKLNSGCSWLSEIEVPYLSERQREKEILEEANFFVAKTFTLRDLNVNRPLRHPSLSADLSRADLEYGRESESQPLLVGVENTITDDRPTSSFLFIAGGLYQKEALDAGGNPQEKESQPIPADKLLQVTYGLFDLVGKVNGRWLTKIDYGWGLVDALAFGGRTEGGRKFWGHFDAQGQGLIFSIPSNPDTYWVNPVELTEDTVETAKLFLQPDYLGRRRLVPADPLDDKTGLPTHMAKQAFEMRLFNVANEDVKKSRSAATILHVINDYGQGGPKHEKDQAIAKIIKSGLSADFFILEGADQIMHRFDRALKPGVSSSEYFEFIKKQAGEIFRLPENITWRIEQAKEGRFLILADGVDEQGEWTVKVTEASISLNLNRR